MYKRGSAVTAENSLLQTVAKSRVCLSVVNLRTVIEHKASIAVHCMYRQRIRFREYIPIEGVNRLSCSRAGSLTAGFQLQRLHISCVHIYHPYGPISSIYYKQMRIREADLLRTVEFVGTKRSIHKPCSSACASEHLHLMVSHMKQFETVIAGICDEEVLRGAVLVEDCGERSVELGCGIVAEAEPRDIGSAED